MKNNRGMVFMGSGFELLGVVLASLWVGGQVDAYFGSKNLATAIFMFIGIFGWGFHFLILIQRITKIEAQENEKNSGDKP